MNLRHAGVVAASAGVVFGLAALAVVSALHSTVNTPVTVIGVVMTSDPDPRDQVPISQARVIVYGRSGGAEARTDASGFFSLNLPAGVKEGQTLSVFVVHPEYKPSDTRVRLSDKPVLVWLSPAHPKRAPHEAKQTVISRDVRIRYTVKEATNVNVGTVANTFQAVNTAGKPCQQGNLCSPDGRWAAAQGSLTLTAPEDGRYSNLRVSCIAGPCPFTRIDAKDLIDGGHTLHIVAESWSATATFLVEADTYHTIISDMVRQAYPVIFPPSLTFTLPGTAGGPSIEAEVNGQPIVFPLGPALHLSWATCSSKENPDHSRLYSCELKPGYRFQ